MTCMRGKANFWWGLKFTQGSSKRDCGTGRATTKEGSTSRESGLKTSLCTCPCQCSSSSWRRWKNRNKKK